MTAKKKKKGGGIFWKLLFLVALCVFCFYVSAGKYLSGV